MHVQALRRIGYSSDCAEDIRTRTLNKEQKSTSCNQEDVLGEWVSTELGN